MESLNEVIPCSTQSATWASVTRDVGQADATDHRTVPHQLDVARQQLVRLDQLGPDVDRRLDRVEDRVGPPLPR
jgi:hypothetical protein